MKTLKGERLLWCTLLHAELQSEIANGRGDGERSVQCMRIGVRLRIRLRDEYGVDFDNLGNKARDDFHALLRAEVAQEEADKVEERRRQETLERARQLLASRGPVKVEEVPDVMWGTWLHVAGERFAHLFQSEGPWSACGAVHRGSLQARNMAKGDVLCKSCLKVPQTL